MKDLNALARPEASKRPPRRRASAGEKGPQCIQGGGDVHPGQVEAPDKVLIAVVRAKAS